ncbi:unnamed protein product, partial [Mesorhabditis belari]
HYEQFKRLRDKLINEPKNLSLEEKLKVCTEIGKIYQLMKTLSQKKIRLTESVEQILRLIANKVTKDQLQFKWDLEAENPRQASLIRDEDSISNFLADEDINDLDDTPQMPSPPREMLDIIKDDPGSIFNYDNIRNGGISSKPPLNFYHGTLHETVQQAFDPVGKGVEDRRPLALYLHHDRGIASNIFPPTILCSESVS